MFELSILIIFIFGAIVGSFLNVVIDRLSTGRSIVYGRSYCEGCKKTLKPYDLLPIVSYLVLRGKCRYCKAKIPIRILIVETLSAITFGLIYLSVLGLTLSFLPAVFLGAIFLCFIGIFFADLEYGIIPDFLVIVSTFSSLFYLLFSNQLVIPHFIAGIATLAFFLLLYVITRGRGMGLGDVKLSFVLGFFLGFPSIIVALYLAFLTGAGVSIILVVWKKIRFLGGTIPFGPFLVGSAVVAYFFGTIIIQRFLIGIL
jgi:leader peptidase (prepilin peptidase)/N-methyltransferase